MRLPARPASCAPWSRTGGSTRTPWCPATRSVRSSSAPPRGRGDRRGGRSRLRRTRPEDHRPARLRRHRRRRVHERHSALGRPPPRHRRALRRPGDDAAIRPGSRRSPPAARGARPHRRDHRRGPRLRRGHGPAQRGRPVVLRGRARRPRRPRAPAKGSPPPRPRRASRSPDSPTRASPEGRAPSGATPQPASACGGAGWRRGCGRACGRTAPGPGARSGRRPGPRCSGCAACGRSRPS